MLVDLSLLRIPLNLILLHSSLTLDTKSYSSLVPAINNISSTYLKLLMLAHPISIPSLSLIFPRMISFCSENKSGESTHPC